MLIPVDEDAVVTRSDPAPSRCRTYVFTTHSAYSRGIARCVEGSCSRMVDVDGLVGEWRAEVGGKVSSWDSTVGVELVVQVLTNQVSQIPDLISPL